MTTLTFALARALARACSPGDEIVITQLDHEANRGPWLALAERGLVMREVALRPDGTLDADELRRRDQPAHAAGGDGAASNALGTVNDVALARELTRAVGAWLLVDAVHYAPHFALDVAALDPDFLLCSAYKFYGPHVGVLYSRPGLLDTLATDRLRAQDPAAPYRIETGTLNHAALAGVGAAIDFLAIWGAAPTCARAWSTPWPGSASGRGRWPGATGARCGTSRASPCAAPASTTDAGRRRCRITLDGVTAEVVARRLGERGDPGLGRQLLRRARGRGARPRGRRRPAAHRLPALQHPRRGRPPARRAGGDRGAG